MEDVMARYRCYFIGSHGQLVGAENVDGANDEEAIAIARRLFAQKAYASGFELRQGQRRIATQEVRVS
jgi:hypothetical protein